MTKNAQRLAFRKNSRRVQVRISTDARRLLKIMAAVDGVAQCALLEDALELYRGRRHPGLGPIPLQDRRRLDDEADR
jgi:hypothetical protein